MALLLVLFLGAIGVYPSTAGADPPQLEKPKGERCIRDTNWMRHNHMDLLKHNRSLTVREGKRIRSESLLQCAGCHPNRDRFCDRCHGYVAVAPDCFECHIYPE
ncbi:MAG: Hdr-like menaquinol oxidoreductase cytochrome c subunit [Magnetococcales bacterium]|nr:Hdr-like menaquinol oxidoreductase cytochrome c subunit [Magnetococcales bacterium]